MVIFVYNQATALCTVRKAGNSWQCFSSVSTSNNISTNSHTSKQGQKLCWNNKPRTIFNLYLFKITRHFLNKTYNMNHWINSTIRIWSLEKFLYVSKSNKMIEFKISPWKYAFKKLFVLLRYNLELRLKRSIC